MPPQRRTIPIAGHSLAIQVTDDSSRTLIDPKTQIAYHSGSGAVAETKHVYLSNSGVDERIAAKEPTSVLEIGLGTGMGMLLTLDRALCESGRLQYHAVESNWLNREVLSQLHLEKALSDPCVATAYLDWRASLGDPPSLGTHHWDLGSEISVTVHHNDALRCRFRNGLRFDAIYFDPFAPNVNPQLWCSAYLTQMHSLLHPSGRLVTYCVNRSVKDALRDAGFAVQIVPGPVGGKREVMIATSTAS